MADILEKVEELKSNSLLNEHTGAGAVDMYLNAGNMVGDALSVFDQDRKTYASDIEDSIAGLGEEIEASQKELLGQNGIPVRGESGELIYPTSVPDQAPPSGSMPFGNMGLLPGSGISVSSCVCVVVIFSFMMAMMYK